MDRGRGGKFSETCRGSCQLAVAGSCKEAVWAWADLRELRALLRFGVLAGSGAQSRERRPGRLRVTAHRPSPMRRPRCRPTPRFHHTQTVLRRHSGRTGTRKGSVKERKASQSSESGGMEGSSSARNFHHQHSSRRAFARPSTLAVVGGHNFMVRPGGPAWRGWARVPRVLRQADLGFCPSQFRRRSRRRWIGG